MPDNDFKPYASPSDLLRMGIFDGRYFDDDPGSCPIPIREVKRVNLFKPGISKDREYWIERGWITPEDPLGWFQWYCRYHAGRRIPPLDDWQIRRWKNFSRHSAQVKLHGRGIAKNRAGQRQALLHWAHDPFPDRVGLIDRELDRLGVVQKGIQ